MIELCRSTCFILQKLHKWHVWKAKFREHVSEVYIIMFIQDNQKIFKNSIKMMIKPSLYDEITFLNWYCRIQKPRSPMTGMSVKRLMTLMTRNQRTGTSLSTSPTQMLRNPTTGMMRWTENGSHPRLTTQSTRYAHAMLPYFFNGINFVNEKY